MKVEALTDLHVKGRKSIKKGTEFDTRDKGIDISDANAKILLEQKKIKAIKE